MTTADWIKRRRELLDADPGVAEALRAGAAAHTRHTGTERGSDDLVICAECGWAYAPGFAVDEGDSRVHEHKATVAIDAALPHLFAAARTSLPLALDALDAVLAQHRPVSYAATANCGLVLYEVCPTCHDKAGVHPCGCWRDEDQIHVCADCKRVWPCPTFEAIETALAGGCRECRQIDGHKLDCGRRT